MKHQKIFTLLLLSSIFLSTIPVVSAKEMQSNNEILEIEPMKTFQDNTGHASEQTITVTTIQSKERTAGYHFSISPVLIDYGEIIPTDPVLRSNTITVRNTALPVFSVFLREDHPLQMVNSMITIPDTTCDNGACTRYTASGWTNTLSFGFGYRCDAEILNTCSKGFTSKNTFKQFPSSEQGEDMVSVMQGILSQTDNAATITYKVNTAASQPSGSYSNTVEYILAPGY